MSFDYIYKRGLRRRTSKNEDQLPSLPSQYCVGTIDSGEIMDFVYKLMNLRHIVILAVSIILKSS